MKALPEPWFDELARMVEEGGIWPEVLLDAKIAVISKAGGDATPSWSAPPFVSFLLSICSYGATRGLIQVLGSRFGEECWGEGSVLC